MQHGAGHHRAGEDLSADAAHASYLERRHFASLDGLRCLSIVPVVWHHSALGPLPGVLGKGPVGVALFFAISGYLITTLLLRERRATNAVDLGGFYARRGLRIFPLYYLVLALYVLRALALDPGSPVSAHFLQALPFYATYTANWFVDFHVAHPILFVFAWSLCVEEQFYATWPVALRLLRGRGLAALLMAAVVAGDLAVEHGYVAIDGTARRIVTSFATPIGLGALAAIAADTARGFALLRLVLGHVAGAPLAFASVALLLVLDGVPEALLDASLVLLVVSVAIPAHTSLAPVLENPLVRHLGTVSYGIYLWHMTAIGIVRRLAPGLVERPVLVFVLALPLSVLIATLSYRLYEQRFLRLRDRFRPAS